MHTELKNWTLTVLPHRDYCACRIPPHTRPELPPKTGVTIPAAVPGCFELDLLRAGLLEDPYWGENITRLRELEDRHLLYRTTFPKPRLEEEELVLLRFEGIDTYADIFLNGTLRLSTDNMLMTYEFPLSREEWEALREEDNELLVHIHPTMLRAQEEILPPSAATFPFGYASLYTRKPPSSFGWDILCRAVSGGLWRPVYLDTVKTPAIRETFLYTRRVDPSPKDPARGDAELNLYYALDLGGDTYYPFDQATHPRELPNDYTLTVTGVCGDSRFSVTEGLWHTCGNLLIPLPQAYLWYPGNAGTPYLYDVTVTLCRGGIPVDTQTLRTGVRTVALERTGFAGREGDFRLLVNHKPIFAMGSNWVPLDALHARDAERLPQALSLLEGLGCNILRCWGGNVYEDHPFFDYCDSHGILVWQDFAMGCAIYPTDKTMEDRLRREVEQVVKRLRNHPSLCLWAGDNECDMAWWSWHGIPRDPSGNTLTRRVIPEVLRLQDFTRPYLPSSPYLDPTVIEAMKHPALREGRDSTDLSEDHLWGPRDYFKGEYYRRADCHFASEIGYHGCPSPRALRTFLPSEELWPIFDRATVEDPFAGDPRPSWFLHQTTMETAYTGGFHYRIRLMTDQVLQMFTQPPRDLDSFARMSQASQAEAMKYFIERFRTAKWRRTGIIWWNLLDGWPQISDAVVSYDLTPKLAYSFIRRVQAPLHMAFSDPQEGRMTLHAINDTGEEADFCFTVKDVTGLPPHTDLSRVPCLLSGQVTAPADSVVPAASLPLQFPSPSETSSAEKTPVEDRRFLLIEWQDAHGYHRSHHIPEPRHMHSATYLQALSLCGFDNWEGFDA